MTKLIATVYTREQAKESDRVLARLWMDRARARARLRTAETCVHQMAGDRQIHYGGGHREWKFSLTEAVAHVANKAKGPFVNGAAEAKRSLAELGLAREAKDRLDEVVKAQQREWAEHGRWPRYLVVPGGHIHNSDGCFTLRYDTDTRWIPELSGDTEADAVERYGAALCSHCYPSTPSYWRELATVPTNAEGNPLTKAEAEAVKTAKRAEKDAKAAAKATAEVRNREGEVLYKTDRAAGNAIVGALRDLIVYGESHPDAPEWHGVVHEGVAALADKWGRDSAELREEFAKKAQKSYERSMRQAWKAAQRWEPKYWSEELVAWARARGLM